jgi:hypothetical protein
LASLGFTIASSNDIGYSPLRASLRHTGNKCNAKYGES